MLIDWHVHINDPKYMGPPYWRHPVPMTMEHALAAHALAGLDPGDGALAHVVIKAIGVAILDPKTLDGAQLLTPRRTSVLQRLLVGHRHPRVPFRGLGLETFDHLNRAAVAGLGRIALIAGAGSRRDGQN